MRIGIVITALLLLLVPASDAQIIINVLYVDVVKGSDANPGTGKNAPLKTITKALSLAGAGYLVSVAPGTYWQGSGEVFPLVFPDKVQMFSSHGARTTIIDAKGTGKLIFDLSASASSTRIAGFTITGGRRTGIAPSLPFHGGAVICRNGAAAVLERNRFVDNGVTGAPGSSAHPNGGDGRGGAVYIDSGSSCTIRNNVFFSNYAKGGQGQSGAANGNARGGALLANGPATVTHNTFVANTASGATALAGAIYAANAAIVANNIIQSNTATGSAAADGGASIANSTVTHNAIFGSTPPESVSYPNTLAVAIVFADHATFHLAAGSPAQSAGSPAYAATHDFEAAPRPDPPALGAQEPKVRHDVDGDAKADLVWHNAVSGEHTVWFMSGTNVPTVAVLPPLDPAYNAVAAADFNGDRRTDILFRHKISGDNVIWFLNAGNATVGAVIKATTTAVSDVSWRVTATGDFNSDGNDDVAWRHGNGNMRVWLMEGTAVLSEVWLPATVDAQWRVVASADFNADGYDDLLWRHSLNDGAKIWFLAAGAFAGDQPLPLQDSSQWQFAGAGDFYADQSPDVIWREVATGEHLLWPIEGGMIAPTLLLESWSNSAWRLERVVNVDGDRYDDLFWRNTTTQQVAIQLMSGPDVTADAIIATSLTTDWKTVP